MIREDTWTVEIFLSEDEGETRADAMLRCGAGQEVLASGVARCDPDDYDIPEIGAEVAASRALAELARKLRRTAADDIQTVTGTRARVHP
ncbi:conserved hypothetical protein [Frankia canadensis]|uniref:DUF1876 domain-containing protein n=1 Tax=Frankia canadensis TaxID=1836972 RepID=A0A2I2KYZ4_9ACTN|nr:DUF1876 domain-containing protein [Frankia canadensis]SNQ50892.1 conserved hypothetical protein [Frankia canadensis]SOU58182.1 conserved hypothetical protein [Frankia canadensis]